MSGLQALLHRRPEGRPGAGVREAVVLSGGGSLGAAQVGALRALFEAGIRPDLFVGCSVGALNAAFLAVNPTLDRLAELEQVWYRLDRKDIFGSRRLAGQVLQLAVRRGDHLCDPQALRALVRRWVPLEDLSDTAVPCHVVTTDLRSGRPCWWSAGDPVALLTASACLPAIFPPVPLDGSLHVDGGVTCPVPVQRALELGATRTWVVDVNGAGDDRSTDPRNPLEVLLRAFAISRSSLDGGTPAGDPPGQRVVRLPRIHAGPVEMRDFRHTARLMQVGYAAGRVAVAGEAAAVPAPRRPTGAGRRRQPAVRPALVPTS
ncbi:MAG: patatin-like phospholipase family protein [Mycobacteriales bacterium]